MHKTLLCIMCLKCVCVFVHVRVRCARALCACVVRVRCVHLRVCVYVWVCALVWMCLCVCVRVCVHACMRASVRVRVPVCASQKSDNLHIQECKASIHQLLGTRGQKSLSKDTPPAVPQPERDVCVARRPSRGCGPGRGKIRQNSQHTAAAPGWLIVGGVSYRGWEPIFYEVYECEHRTMAGACWRYKDGETGLCGCRMPSTYQCSSRVLQLHLKSNVIDCYFSFQVH